MKKYLLSIFTIGLFGLFLGYQKVQSNQAHDLAVATSIAAGSTDTSNTTQTPVSNSGALTTNIKTTIIASKPVSSTNIGKYKNGNYVGMTADAYYGNIQVEAVIKNGSITDVVFLQYPNDQDQSIQINTRAMPALRSEAISAQSANVAIVSRATDSSLAFRQSLASALSSAIN